MSVQTSPVAACTASASPKSRRIYIVPTHASSSISANDGAAPFLHGQHESRLSAPTRGAEVGQTVGVGSGSRSGVGSSASPQRLPPRPGRSRAPFLLQSRLLGGQLELSLSLRSPDQAVVSFLLQSRLQLQLRAPALRRLSATAAASPPVAPAGRCGKRAAQRKAAPTVQLLHGSCAGRRAAERLWAGARGTEPRRASEARLWAGVHGERSGGGRDTRLRAGAREPRGCGQAHTGNGAAVGEQRGCG